MFNLIKIIRRKTDADRIIQSTCATIVSRILLQNALKSFYKNDGNANFTSAQADMQSALASGGYSALLQTVVYSRNGMSICRVGSGRFS